MNESELIDVLVAINHHNFIVEQKQFDKGSKEAEHAKASIAVLAYKGMKEGYGIYRQVNNKYVEIHPEVDYPKLFELVKTFDEKENSNTMGGK